MKGEKVLNPTSIAFAILAITINFSRATNLKEPEKVLWKKPPGNLYKLNVDATYFENGMGAAAAILRNSCGEAVAGVSWLLTHLHDATTAEAIALQRGLELLEDLGCQLVIVESDSLEIIQACNGVIEI